MTGSVEQGWDISEDLIDVAQVIDAATRFRAALEMGGLRSVGLSAFPRGACGDACELLGEYFVDSGLGEWSHRSGRLRAAQVTHAWLERGGMVVDITADQFDEVAEAVLVSRDDTWHRAFRADGNARTASIHSFSGPASADLGLDYVTLRTRADAMRSAL